MKFLVIGTGFIFPVHTDAIRSVGGKIREVVNTVHSKEYWPWAIRNSDADWVVILTPNDLHVPMVQEALKYGKKVLCEKPIAISSKDAEAINVPGVFTVLQLRNHPLTKKMAQQARESQYFAIDMFIEVHRDHDYYQSWKGQEKRSGGILFNLGIHYFDLLLHVFGPAIDVSIKYNDGKTVGGLIKGERFTCRFHLTTNADKEKQRRIYKVNGESYNFSSKDNLSFENLHRSVYYDLIYNEGTTVADCLPAIRLIESLQGANATK